MKNRWMLAAVVLSVISSAAAQGTAPATTQTKTSSQQSANASAGSLDAAYNVLDRTAASFKNIQTDFVWDQYNKVVDDHDIQSGTMYFRRNGQSVEMIANINKPDTKQVLFADGLVRVYQPRMETQTVYSAGKNKNDFESFLVLGFGGRGHDLPKSFDVKYAGMETVNGANAYKLELTPKSEKVRNMFTLITLWIDKDKGVSVQQRFDERSGDFRLAKYSNIKMLDKLNNDVFKLKTTPNTKTLKPNG
jgi:outer membrane lipoprotein-sorting protein